MIKFERNLDYPHKGDISIAYYVSNERKYGATISPHVSRKNAYYYYEFTDDLTGLNRKTFKTRLRALKYMLKRKPSFKAKALEADK